jgi:L-ascorbate metabolism protein UlaG (beta-lactamase superfamily)
MLMTLAITRIVNACVLMEIAGHAVLADPWFRDHWYFRFGERLGMSVRELPRLAAILGTHALPNHWDFRSLADYPWKNGTPVFVATSKMAKQATRIGFKDVEVVSWGTRRSIAPNVALEVVEAHRDLGGPVNSYVLSSQSARIFYGGEARDLEPLRCYRREHSPVDIAIAPVNGVHFFGRKLVMGPQDLIEAARILGAGDVVPIHDALDPIHRFFPELILKRTGSAQDAKLLGEGSAEGSMRVHCLATGEQWQRGSFPP